VDQDIISLDVPRSAEEAKQSMHFKDSMRERALADIAEAWAGLVAAYAGPDPATAAAVLATVQRYVHWIDIGLVANDRFMPLLFGALVAPQEELRGAAADVLTEIVRWAGRVGGGLLGATGAWRKYIISWLSFTRGPTPFCLHRPPPWPPPRPLAPALALPVAVPVAVLQQAHGGQPQAFVVVTLSYLLLVFCGMQQAHGGHSQAGADPAAGRGACVLPLAGRAASGG